MDWCVQPFEQANHAPVITVNDDQSPDATVIEVRPGTQVQFEANAEDPDGDAVRFQWYQYPEAGTYAGPVKLPNADRAICSFTAPSTSRTETVHLILEVKDDGVPPLTSYRRCVARIVPE